MTQWWKKRQRKEDGQDEHESLLSHSESSSLTDFSLEESSARRIDRWIRRQWLILAPIALLSLGLNILTIVHFVSSPATEPCHVKRPHSANAKLKQTHPVRWAYSTAYGPSNTNTTEKTTLWQTLDTTPAAVSLPHTWTDAHSLPRSVSSSTSEGHGIYLLNGYYNMHCLKLLHAYTYASHTDTLASPAVPPYVQIEHCLDTLLQEVRCQADDGLRARVPRDEGGDQQAGVAFGDGQVRMCRSWGKLEAFARKHRACEEGDRPVDTGLDGLSAC